MTKVYFNELSACGSVDDANVKHAIEEMLSCLKYLHGLNIDAVLVDGNIGLYKISNNRIIYQILGDKNVLDDDNATFLIAYFQSECQLREEIEDNAITSAKCGTQNTVGLTLASDYLNKGIALSFSYAGWDEKYYNLQLEVLVENGDIIDASTTSANASSEATLRLYGNLLPSVQVNVPESGKLLFMELYNLFPNLIFSAAAIDYIKHCQSKEMTAQIFWRLDDLNKVASSFGGKPFEKMMFASKASPESGTRDRLSELDVQFEDGIVRHCSWHLRYTPGAGRVHFSSDTGDGKTIYVGYVGKKIKA